MNGACSFENIFNKDNVIKSFDRSQIFSSFKDLS